MPADEGKRMKLVETCLEDGVGVITFNRPEKRNAMSDAMVEQWRAAISWVTNDRDVRAVLLRAEGPSFCAGRDITQLGDRVNGESDWSFVRRHQDDALARLRLDKPFVAAVNGSAVGGGLEIALSADIRIAADDAVLSFPEVQFGLIPDTGGTALATMMIGPSRTKIMVMTGRPVDAMTALDWGLVDQVVPRAQLDKAAMDLATELAAGPPLALAMAKHSIDQIWESVLLSGLRTELIAQSALFRSDDRAEAAASRREERPPRWTGR
jgi:enoyl-CoA hydratase/carnithine racemase